MRAKLTEKKSDNLSLIKNFDNCNHFMANLICGLLFISKFLRNLAL